MCLQLFHTAADRGQHSKMGISLGTRPYMRILSGPQTSKPDVLSRRTRVLTGDE